jgi:16S rRNA processing protein RimM
MDSASNSTSATPPDSADAAAAWDDMRLVGIVARTQGNTGEVIVNSTTDFPDDRFAVGAVVWGRAAGGGAVERLEIQRYRMHVGRPVVGFAGAASIGDAERYAGWELRVPGAARQPLPPHVYYHDDLVGCEVVTTVGEAVGHVRAIDGDGEAVRLVVTAARGEVLVPLVQAYCAVDVAARRIVIDPPDGLLDVNGAWRG